jgi:hypothetical protein
MSWDYRVIRTEGEAGARYAIYEVYYDDEDRPEARTGHPSYPAGETLEELQEDLHSYQAALSQPVLDDALFGSSSQTEWEGYCHPIACQPEATGSSISTRE